MSNAKPWFFLLALLVVAAVAALSCWVTGRLLAPRAQQPSGSAVEGHHSVHRELRLTSGQDRALDVVEEKYARRRRELTATIRAANHELAQAVLEDRAYSPRVTAAVDKIHQAQGELQKATMEHVFEMRQALSAGQYERLLQLTAQALDATPAADAEPH
jgi:Spy/CpxP family protein refolding chaperone